MKNKVKFYTRQLNRAIAFGNPKAIEYSREKLQKTKEELQREKEVKLLERTLIFMAVFTIASPFIIYLLGLY